MTTKAIVQISLFLTFFLIFNSPGESFGGLSNYFQESAEWLDGNLSILPKNMKGIHGQEIPLHFKKTPEHHMANVGTAWRLHIPYVSLEIHPSSTTNGVEGQAQDFYVSSMHGRLVQKTNPAEWVPTVQNGNQEETWKKIEHGGKTTGFIYHSQGRPREIWVFEEQVRDSTGKPVMWFLSKIHHQFGEVIKFNYSKNSQKCFKNICIQGLPNIVSITSNMQPLALFFNYIQKQYPAFTSKYGVLIGELNDLSSMTSKNVKLGQNLAAVKAFYVSASSAKNGQAHLRRLVATDLLNPSSVPPRTVEVCTLAICPTGPSQGPQWHRETLPLPSFQADAISQGQVGIVHHPKTALPMLITPFPISNQNLSLGQKRANFLLFESIVDKNGKRLLFQGVPRSLPLPLSNDADFKFGPRVSWGATNRNSGEVRLWFKNGPHAFEHIVDLFKAENGITSNAPNWDRAHQETILGLMNSKPDFENIRSGKSSPVKLLAGQEWERRESSSPSEDPIEGAKNNTWLYHSLFVDTNGDGIKEFVELERPDKKNKRLVRVRVWHRSRKGELLPHPIESQLNVPPYYPLSHLIFFDGNNNGYLDIIQLPFTNSHISSKSPVYFFENVAGHGFLDGRPLKDITLPPLGIREQAWVLDTKASGRDDLLIFENGFLHILSAAQDTQRSDAPVSMTFNHGLEVRYSYAPVSFFFGQTPLASPGLKGPILPNIAKGMSLVHEIQKTDLVTQETRTKRFRYFGPKTNFQDNALAGFQIVEEAHSRLGQAPTVTNQFIRLLDVDSSIRDWGVQTINTFDSNSDLAKSIQHTSFFFQLPSWKKKGPSGHENSQFNTKNTFELPSLRLIKETATFHYFPEGTTQSSVVYTYDPSVEEMMKKARARSCEPQLMSTSWSHWNSNWIAVEDGRSKKHLFYKEPFHWTFKDFVFYDKSLVYRQLWTDPQGKLLRDERAEFDTHLGLRRAHILCGDKDCSPASSKITKSTYNALGFPQKIIRPRGSQVNYFFDKDYPYIFRKIVESGQDVLTRVTAILNLDALMEPSQEMTPQGDIRKTVRSGWGYTVSQTLGTTLTQQKIDMTARALISKVKPRYGNEDARETRQVFNAFGERVQSATVGVKSKFFHYDHLGRPVAKSIDLPPDFIPPDHKKQPLLYHLTEYDSLNRITRTQRPGGRSESIYRFKPFHMSLAEVSLTPVPKQRISHFKLNPWGEIIGFTNPLGGEYTLERDGIGQVTDLHIPHGVSRHFSYDVAGRTVRIAESLNTPTPSPGRSRVLREFVYGVDEHPETIIGPEGFCAKHPYKTSCREAHLTYDSLGRLVKRIAVSGKGESKHSSTLKVAFDTPVGYPLGQVHDGKKAIGQPTYVRVEWDGGHVTRRYYYNTQGLLSETQQKLNDGFIHTLQRLYNGFGEEVSLIYPDGFQTFSIRDYAGRIVGVKAHEAGSRHTQTLARYSKFTPFGAAQEVLIGNGLVRRTLFQGLLPIVSAVSLSGVNAQQHFEAKYTFDGFGNVVETHESAGHFEFNYDDLDQLRLAKGPFGDQESLSYHFDEGGRGLQVGGKHIHYDTHIDPYRPTHVTGTDGSLLWQYNYTKAGQQKVRVSFKNGIPDVAQRLVWDANGLLEGVWEDPQGGSTYTPVQFMAYDERQEKVASVDAFGHSTQYMGKLFESSAFGTVRHIFGGQGERLATYITSTPHRMKATHSHKPSFHSALAGLLHPVSYLNTVSQERNRLIFLHSDALGQLRLITDHKSFVLEKQQFKPFGERVTPTGQIITPERSKTAMRGELHAMGVRLYDAEVGQFVSRDPHFSVNVALGGEALELGLYNYARNNPLKYNDPSGEFATPLGAINASIYLASQATRSDLNSLNWQQVMGIGARAVVMLNPITDMAYRAGSATLGKDLLTGESTSIPSYILGTAVDYTIGKAVHKVLNTTVNGYFNWQWLPPSKGASKTSGLTNSIDKPATQLAQSFAQEPKTIKLFDGRVLDLTRHKIRTSQHYDRAFVEPKGHHIHQKFVFDDWNNFLGPNQTNISPFTGKVSPDRIWSLDGKRSIRMGPHEMSRDLHYHKETWFDKLVVNEMKRVYTTLD